MPKHNIHHEKNGRFVPVESPEAAAVRRKAPPHLPMQKPYETGNPGSQEPPPAPPLSKWVEANRRG